MSDLPWLPLAGGALAGLAVALLIVLFVQLRRRATGRDVVAAARAEAATLARTSKADADQLLRSAQADSDRLTADARRAADSARTDAILAGKMETLALREELDKETQSRREEWARQDRRAEERERAYDRRQEQLTALEGAIQTRDASITAREQALAAREKEIDALKAEQARRLEQIAGLTAEEARRELLQRAEEAARSEAAALARDIKEQAKKGAEREAQRIVSIAIQRIAPEQTAATTVAAVTLPSDEMKGRIIGREGRNIRAFELATGVDVIIDDTPDTVVISCFDPIRREVGRRALEALIADGRIQPGRIEDVVVKVRAELDTQLVELGERAAFDTGISGLHPELIKLVGRMRYRTSYGQNILEHSKEVAWLAGIMAAELGVDVKLAKRGAFLHDIGKVLTHDSEGTHVELGVEVARRYGESAAVINCIHAHHDDVPHESTESVLVQAADGISGSRPGARREAFESYVKRLTKLEEIANAFRGVEKTAVIQAGREIRVIVTPDQVNDAQAAELSEQIARKIENELQYPGQIRVVVIRETRSVEVAR
ncbi:MAG TPA: ribonuclease Y [Gemmatimonadales bacterium]|nr:ribonuclease Y [Gemmatimonadales bacterium]HRZ10251.1 ribonuclease Y [Gemmatimonadales bacterium]